MPEDRLRFQAQLLEAVHQAIVATDTRGSIIYWNRAAEALYGWRGEEVAGRNAVQLTLAPRSVRLAQRVRDRLELGQSWSGELVIRRRDGAEVPVLAAVSPLRDTQGAVCGTVAVASDLSEQKAVEGALRRSEERFEMLFRASPAAIVISDFGDGRLVEANERYCELLGYRRDELIGRFLPDLGLDLRRGSRLGRELSDKRSLRNLEVRLPRKGGEAIDALASVELGDFIDEDEPIVIAMLLDVTEAKRAERVMRESEERHRLLVELSPVAIFVHRGPKILYANPATVEIAGAVDASELVGRAFFDLGAPDQGTGVSAVVEETEKEAGLRHGVETWKRRDGVVHNLEMTSAPIRFQNEPARLVIAHDVTEQVRIQQEVRTSREELRRLTTHLQRVREDEQARIAREIHDQLGQLLTGLKLGVSWLEHQVREADGPLEPGNLLERVEVMQELAEESLRSVQRLATDLRPPILDDLGLEAAAELQGEEFERRTGIPCGVTSHLPPGTQLDRGPATAIYRILQEALTNAARHAEPSRVEVELREENDELVLEVSDDGVGMALNEQRDLSSLGIVGMRERARACGGKVEIHSAPGEGTRVLVRCPATESGSRIAERL